MRALFFILAFLLLSKEGKAQQSPTFKIATDKDIYFQGDSLHWQCSLNGFNKHFNAVTVQVWIENLRNGMKWQYRFPVVNGYAEGAMKISNMIAPGRYAFNFLLQADFFNISGTVAKVRAKDTVLNYFMLFKDKETMVEQVKTAADGSFNIRGLVFQDTAMLSFSKPGTKTEPSVILTTSLDSAFTPVLPAVTKFINIVDPAAAKDSVSSSDINLNKDYHFEIKNDVKRQQMNEVIIKDRKSDKLVKDYQEAYVSGQFRSADEITLDGLSNDDIIQSGNIYNYLMMHVPGLTVSNNPETGIQEVKWRNTSVAIYVDEFRVPDEMPLTVTPGEVAIIKVFRPGSGPLTGGMSNSGSIAIYTKIGPYSRFLPASDQHNRFYIRGYDGRTIEWN